MAVQLTNPFISNLPNIGAPQVLYLSDGTAIFCCQGSPQGVIFAERGSIALDLLTGDAYIKTLGYASNNGWNLLLSAGASPTFAAPVNITGANANGLNVTGSTPLLGATNSGTNGGFTLFAISSAVGALSALTNPGDGIWLLDGQTAGNGHQYIVNDSGQANAAIILAVEDLETARVDARGLGLRNKASVPVAQVDGVWLYSTDAAGGDAQLYAINEVGQRSRLTNRVKYNPNVASVTSSVTPVLVAGLRFNVLAGEVYRYSARLQTSSNVTGGVRATINGTATATALSQYSYIFNDLGAVVAKARTTSLGNGVNFAGAGATVCDITLDGVIQVNVGGNIEVRFAQSVSDAGASTVLALGGTFEIENVS